MLETFKQLDTNHDGVLSINELKAGLDQIKVFMTKEEIEHLVD